MSREQAGRFGPITMQDVRLRAGEGRLNAQDVLAAVNAELSVREERAALAPTVSGGEGWEELERLAQRCTSGDPWYKEGDLCGRQTFGQFLSQDRAFIAAANPQTVLALIAVARGGGAALREQARSVPTEGHGAAVVGLRDALELAERAMNEVANALNPNAEFTGWDLRKSYSIATLSLAQIKAAKALAATSEAEQVGTSGASEPNTLPTVQAETAVVGEAEAFKVVQVIKMRADALGDEQYGKLAQEAMDYLEQPPVSTGDQPGMSEEPFGHWVEHTAAEPVFILSSRGAYVPTGPNYKATPLYAAPTLPDDLLSLSEAATQGEWGGYTSGKPEYRNVTYYVERNPPSDHPFIAEVQTKEDRDLIVASVNFIRTLAAKQGGKS